MLINCHSHYSLRYGTMSIEQLVQNAKELKYDCIALTDINCMTGVYDFILECGKQGIKPVVGIEFRNGDELLYVGIARNAVGFRELNEFLSHRNIGKYDFPKTAPTFNDCYIIYPFAQLHQKHFKKHKLRDNEYIGIQTQDINQLFSTKNRDVANKSVILHPVTVASRFEYELHRCLRAMDHNIILDKLQTHQYGALQHHAPPIDKLLEKYDRFPSIAFNTLEILGDCNFQFDFKTVKNKKHYTSSRYEDKEFLTQLAEKGLEERYGENNREAKARLKKELEVIDKLGFSAHFLITWDITQYSTRQGFYHVGRGSGANSIVAYLIGITDVDPIELNLFFERFLNPHRSSPPDFDIDWSHKTRDHILDYIFGRFGKKHTCHVGAVNTFQNRSPIRELGKVFGLPKEEIDALVKNRRRPKQTASQASTLSEMLKDEICQKIEQYCLVMQNKPNQLTMHSCGVLITEEPITQYTALELPPKGYNTSQIDMYISEDIGMEKLDILSQRGLSSIETCLQAIQKNRGEKVNIHQVQKFKQDPELNNKLSRGHTIGCFYIESPAMRGLLRRLKCDNYITLVAASSVIRPGVAKSGMMREFILRHNNKSIIKYPHPIFEEQLGETYGVMVYQEDVIKIAHYFGGLSLADADVLRRAMSGKVRDAQQFEQVKLNFINNCKSFGYDMEIVAEVYRQIESFAGFSFCKAHSASYSVESYQSLYLKTHYPLEFIVGVINNFGGFYRTQVYVHEAKMNGANVCLPCVNHSDYLTNISGIDIHLGFIHIERIDATFKKLIPEERKKNGPYLDLENFISRTNVSYVQLKQLIYVGALRFTNLTKPKLLIQARIMVTKELKKSPKEEAKSSSMSLFTTSSNTKIENYKLPEVQRSIIEDAYDEIDVLGFPLSVSTFELINYDASFNSGISKLKLSYVNQLEKLHETKVTMIGMLISIKDVPTAKGHMNFGTWVDEKGDYFDTTHFPDCLLQFPFSGAGCYALYGKVTVDFHFPSIEIIKMKKLAIKADPRYEDPGLQSSLPTTLELAGGKLPRAPYPSGDQVNSLYGRGTHQQPNPFGKKDDGG